MQVLNADHRTICKFIQPSDPNYRTLRNRLASTVVDIMKNGEFPSYFYRDKLIDRDTDTRTKHQRHRAQMQIISQLLDVHGSPEDELSILEDSRLTSSYEWLINKESFQAWQNEIDSPRYFWLTGKPGIGKSTLAGYIVDYLGVNRCSYYFFKYKDHQRSSLSGFLRSIAYQMANSSYSVRERLIQVSLESPHIDRNDFRNIWRKIFVGGIFQVIFQQM